MKDKVLFEKFVTFTAAVHQITNDITLDVKSDSITPVQYKILEFIAVSPEVTSTQISDCLHISMPNTSRELRKLSEKQLCEKVPDDNDRRKQFIRLTAQGEVMMHEVFQIIGARFFKRIENVSVEERDDITRALDLLQNKVFYQ